MPMASSRVPRTSHRERRRIQSQLQQSLTYLLDQTRGAALQADRPTQAAMSMTTAVRLSAPIPG
ncbi:hypothetical protein CSW29_02430 [Thermus scotoductus]|uniref:Uncharacterized protein n=1 Tax=Thermus scotoductus TaxID=37636 RepID=A0A430UIZ2_THESC|nr:hypothetical protein CSW29_02430 [Thermus scotoductus]